MNNFTRYDISTYLASIGYDAGNIFAANVLYIRKRKHTLRQSSKYLTERKHKKVKSKTRKIKLVQKRH